MTYPTISRNQRRLRAVEEGRRVFGLLLEHGRWRRPPPARSWPAGVWIYDTLLFISELVTNAVTHTLPPVVLHLEAAADGCGRVQIHVSDGGLQPSPKTWAAKRPADEFLPPTRQSQI